MDPVYITCKVLPGIFDDECYVMVNGSSAYYVNVTAVKTWNALNPNVPVDGQVFGYQVERDADKSLVQLTGEVAMGALRTWVENKAVTAA